ncbi:hypothetical protein HaLaN_30202, partial [Haematococcus lacustris]
MVDLYGDNDGDNGGSDHDIVK